MKKTHPSKLALLLSSYSRIPDFLRQVYACAYGQSYAHFHIFASIKGIPESTYYSVILPQVQPIIDSGKLSIHWTGNTNQMWNFLDTVKGEDIEPYDLFLKIDDDDYYHPDYLKYCAAALEMSPIGTSTYVSGNFPACKNAWDTWYNVSTFPLGSTFEGWGNMLGISKKVFKHLLEAQQDVSIIFSDTKLFNWENGLNIGYREDRYYFSCMQHYGPCVDISDLFTNAGITPSIVGAHTMVGSLTRNAAFHSSEFLRTVSNLRMNNGKPPISWIVELVSGELWCVFNGKVTNMDTKKQFSYSVFDNTHLILSDGRSYKKQTNGKYIQVQ